MNLSNRIALLQKAEDAAREGKYDEALGVISRCLDLYPNFSPARVLRAEIYSRTAKPEEAVGELQGIIQANPENIRARILLTGILLDMGDTEKATEHLEFLGFMMPTDDPTLQELRERLEQQQSPTEEPVEEPHAVALDPGIIDDEKAAGVESVREDRGGSQGPEETAMVDEDTEVLDLDELTRMQEADEEGRIPLKDRSEEPTQKIDRPADLMTELEQTEQKPETTPDEVIGPVTAALVEQEAEPLSMTEESIPMDEEQPEESLEGKPDSSKAEQEVSIQTRTMALVYEKQGMYQEAVDILQGLTGPEVAADLERIRGKMMQGTGGKTGRKIARLVTWLEKIQCG